MAEDLPFDDNEFDLAVLINTLEFLDDPLQALREAGRVANRKVFIGVMNSLSLGYLSAKLQGIFRESFFSHIRFYNLWELKSYVQMAYGHVPVVWGCSQFFPYFEGITGGLKSNLWNPKFCPFGSFLGLTATILYWVRTDKIPLKLRVKGARESIARELTMGQFYDRGGAPCDERGLSL
jgi:SAM-dependent methyltransferase